MRFQALAFHAEKLYDDQVWKKVKQVAAWMSHRGIESTFFVYPFRAQVVKIDISERVRALAALGHEIGQHTHFYAGTKIDGHGKVDDFSETNIEHCLRRDFETLCQIGVPPKGFTAGAWVINDTVLGALVKLDFTYDCSAHFPKPTGTPDSPNRRWLRTSQLYTTPAGTLLCLPTVCSLGEWFKWGWRVKIDEPVPYQLVYLHDYDLQSPRNYLPLWAFLIITGRNHFLSGNVLAQQFLNKAET